MNSSLENVEGLFLSQKEKCSSLVKSTHKERKQKLKSLLNNFMEMEDQAIEALSLDLKKNPTESVVSEILGVKTEASFAIKNLKSWMRARRVSSPAAVFFTSGWVRPEPKGCVLIDRKSVV